MPPMTVHDVADLANALFGAESNLMMFNALVEIASGDLDEDLLDGDEQGVPEGSPDVLAVVGRMDTSLMFGMYCIGDAVQADEAREHLREAAAMLGPVEEANPLSIIPMLLHRARTMAAVTVRIGQDGKRYLAFYRNPAVDEAQARAFFVQFFGELTAQMEDDAAGDDPDPTDPAGGGTGPVN